LRWSQDKAFRDRLQGIMSRCVPAKIRGAIVGAMLEQLVRHAVDPLYILGFQLIFHLMLRHDEVVEAMAKDFVEAGRVAGNANPMLRIPFSKGFNLSVGQRAEGQVEAFAPVFLDCLEVPWLAALAKGRGPDGFLFPGWCKYKANSIVQECAARFGWDSQLLWSVHSLRHGKATQMRADGVPLDAIRLKGRWSSAEMASHYAAMPSSTSQAQYGRTRVPGKATRSLPGGSGGKKEKIQLKLQFL
jgi:integrase